MVANAVKLESGLAIQLVSRAVELALSHAEDPLSWQEIAEKVADVCKDTTLTRTCLDRLVTEGKVYRLGFGGASKYWPSNKLVVVFHKKHPYFASLKRGKPVRA